MFLIIFYALIQIVFEALPISSSGHVLLFSVILKEKFAQYLCVPDFFDHFLHLPTVLILLVFFFKDWFTPFSMLFKNLGFGGKANAARAKNLFEIFYKIVKLGLVVDLITAIFYFINHSFFEMFINSHAKFFLLFGFCITATVLFMLHLKEKNNNEKIESFDLKKAAILGVVQGISLFPGISRFGVTYSCLKFMNLSSRRAFQVSFLVQFPLILAAALKGTYDLFKFENVKIFLSFSFLAALVVGLFISYALFKMSYKLALKNKLWYFAFYILLLIITFSSWFFIF
ncbi:MAG: Undecaprenyl-diphosphatase [candidate division TM6 bacterium GW2011_GWE2_31_21]|nr:MAG: Undecaprenyl-diphosphatase [candidate division TM6 bacterium GW2011_GWE2_31_21]KKP53637.1 MAG: Undecaprenyl-diphosphatase [candidate division TM6 bacterium GW2011_GWF2_33_332]